jgi:hypothetical protein
MSGRLDSNQRPPEPHSPAHASPTYQRRFVIIRQAKELRQGQQGLSGGEKLADLTRFGPILPGKSGAKVARKSGTCSLC